MRFTVDDLEAIVDYSTSAALVPGGVAPLASATAVAKQAAPTKVLQNHRSYGALFEVPDNGHLFVTFEIPVNLQVMASTKAEVYDLCFQKTRVPLDTIADMFERHQTLVTTDGESAVGLAIKGGRGISSFPMAPRMHLLCDIHKLAQKRRGASISRGASN